MVKKRCPNIYKLHQLHFPSLTLSVSVEDNTSSSAKAADKKHDNKNTNILVSEIIIVRYLE